MVKFKEYVNEIKEYNDIRVYKGKVFKFIKLGNELEPMTFSYDYFDVMGVEYIGCENDIYVFNVQICWHSNMDKTEFYELKIKFQTILPYKALRDRIIKKGECHQDFLKICESYLKYILNQKVDKIINAKLIGWTRDNGSMEFMGVTEFRYDLPNSISIFNDNIVRNKGSESLPSDYYSELLDWITCDPNLLGIFAYTIHALFYFFGGEDREYAYPDNVFSICIYGKDDNKICLIANILSNVFGYDENNVDRLLKRSVISCSSLRVPFAQLNQMDSVPVIIKHKDNRITKHTSLVHTLDRQRRNRQIGIFPVYLSRYPINADEIIDFCINDCPIIENCTILKEKLNSILIQFIFYLSELDKNRTVGGRCNDDMDTLYSNMGGNIKRRDYYYFEEYRYKILLYIACRGFTIFLRNKLKLYEIADKLMKISRRIFLENKVEKIDTYKYDKKSSISDFVKFVKEVLEQEEQDRSFICISGVEKRGGEECVYFDFKEGYRQYCLFCKRDNLQCINDRTLLKQLKEKNVLKLRESQAQYSMERTITFKGERSKQSVLVLLKKPFLEI